MITFGIVKIVVFFVCFVVNEIFNLSYLDSPSRFQISSAGPDWFRV